MIAEEPLKIAVCEDMEAEAKKLVSVLDRSAIPTVSKVFPSGEALLREYCPQQFDLLLSLRSGKKRGIFLMQIIHRLKFS